MSVLRHGDEVTDPGDHAADLFAIGQRVAVTDLAQPERAHGAARLRLVGDGRADLGDRDGLVARIFLLGGHQCESPAAICFLRSLYALSMPLGTNSSAAKPRRRATSSGRCNDCSPWMVALATLMAFDDPSDLHSTSCTPASSRMMRAAPPAITPVPAAAGFIRTRPAPVTPMMGWVIVLPARGTSNRFFLASSVPFWIASGTSFALPYPRPTRPLPSPTTTSAVKEKRRPPLTTLGTRLIAMTRDSRRPLGAGVELPWLFVYENAAIRTPNLLHERLAQPQRLDRDRRSRHDRTRLSRCPPTWRARRPVCRCGGRRRRGHRHRWRARLIRWSTRRPACGRPRRRSPAARGACWNGTRRGADARPCRRSSCAHASAGGVGMRGGVWRCHSCSCAPSLGLTSCRSCRPCA